MCNAPRRFLPSAAVTTLWLGLALVTNSPATQAGLRYELDYDANTQRMRVGVCRDEAVPHSELRLDRGAAGNIENLQRTHGEIVTVSDARWRIDDWRAGECVRYRANLGVVAASRDRDIGSRVGDDILVAPQQWLLMNDEDLPAEVSVHMPAGYAFSPPWQLLDGSAAEGMRYRIVRTPRNWSALVAIGPFVETRRELPGGDVRIALLGGFNAAQRSIVLSWLDQVLQAAVSAYGELPLPQQQVVVIAANRGGRPVSFGQSIRGEGNAVHLWVDTSSSLAQLREDWTAVHELSHLFHPYLGDEGSWLSEGLASYWQNVLRARGGLLTAVQAWNQLDAGFDRGRRTANATLTLAELSTAMHERGAYYAVYWSGAAYWLQVDVELLARSGGRTGVDEALRRFRDCCLQQRREWAPGEFVAKLDSLLQSDVFERRWREFSATRGFPDLQATYAQLGLERGEGKSLRLRDDAAAVRLRDAILRPRRAR